MGWVTCDRVKGHVIGLDLSCSRLYGTIPSNSSLFLLPHLQRLNLAFNDFKLSEISSGFGGFAKLRYLNLSWSDFEGQVPLKLSHLSQLASLDLSRNYFVRFNTSVMKRLVQNLTKLRELHLDAVDLHSVPLSSFWNLSSSLTSLTLKDCGLHGTLPDDIFQTPNLRELSLRSNHLSGEIPSSFLNHKALSYLDLGLNNLNGKIPSSLSNLEELSYLDLQHNHLCGSIPVSIGNLTKVTQIILQYNNFNGQIPSSLSNLKDLAFVDFSHNNFEGLGGRIPFFSNLTKLIELRLSYNHIKSQIGEFQPNNSLQILRLENNQLYGSIPNSISNLVNLTELDISSNDLGGIVEFDRSTNLKELHTLDLSNNSMFLGIKSNSNNTFPALWGLKLASCKIVEFPNFLQSSKDLEYLDLSNNRISNQIPELMFGVVENIKFLDLHSNLLQGKLPVPPSSIRVFLMSNNKLTGEIPSTICNVSYLEILDISNNSLSGKIPKCLGNLGNSLSVMDLRMNNFNGTIPDTFDKDNWLETLAFNGNHLEGKLPKSLANCEYLEVLDLGNNKINDSLPYWLESLSELRVLVLKNNRFYGPIENHETSGLFFSKLQILDLSHNEFTGHLPSNYFEKFTAMMNEDTHEREYLPQFDDDLYFRAHRTRHKSSYQASVQVTMKGSEIELSKILTIFTEIDLSSNKFQGEIPDTLGWLKFLRFLNLSHNNLTGHIPSSLANLLELESLDLSSNKLTGEIPMQLTSLTFLALLNLSQNKLIGPIPEGKQFATFQNDSYNGNLDLCGFPLSHRCGISESMLPMLPSISEEANDSLFASGFGWRAVLIGYGCGLLYGLAMGCVEFKRGKPKWLVKFV
ncbi:hypothetical protein SO802_014406 [Lithocarpus litseifolius]|uniref:Disease resistance R13L4/SHOC-2-like LRR domain-containing protein n=1 Tax=Lithocarpus litseifolius TaxID=425828 RepID=A0AAW2CUY2_9ROSI